MKCPVCGKNVGAAVLCAKFRADVCQKHCFDGCEYFTDYGGTSVVRCTFRDRMLEKQAALKKASAK
ncbi:MAG: hypothetical protein NC299_09045 [Lachnospiraceae bacterium]|nr:hypothetical protein [Lachnospiraceae bacterium]